MNWWFTNNGIILDTAGRLMLPEVYTGDNPEWDEFLDPQPPPAQLPDQRPDPRHPGRHASSPTRRGDRPQGRATSPTSSTRCSARSASASRSSCWSPSATRSSASASSSRASTAGRAGPVARLVQPRDARRAVQARSRSTSTLKLVHEQLVRRRGRLLQDPVNTEDPSAAAARSDRRAVQPARSAGELAPRLRRYLEPIFVAGPWSAKPLFLRGIYFTSSMQKGSPWTSTWPRPWASRWTTCPRRRTGPRAEPTSCATCSWRRSSRKRGSSRAPPTSTSPSGRARSP